jgi:hypothetical protein
MNLFTISQYLPIEISALISTDILLRQKQRKEKRERSNSRLADS